MSSAPTRAPEAADGLAARLGWTADAIETLLAELRPQGHSSEKSGSCGTFCTR